MLAGGINDGTSDHEILEYLLFHTVPRQDTNKIAHRLIEKFGSLAAVMDADVENLMKLGGLTYNSAALIKMIMPIARAYTARRSQGMKKFSAAQEIAPYLHELYMGYNREVVSVLLINEAGGAMKLEILGYGDVNSVNMSIKTLVEKTLRSGASTVALAHNHPGGLALPSMEDIQVTKEARLALSHIGIRLIDHVIIADDKYLSLAFSDKFSKIF